jgi:hypothetical protein
MEPWLAGLLIAIWVIFGIAVIIYRIKAWDMLYQARAAEKIEIRHQGYNAAMTEINRLQVQDRGIVDARYPETLSAIENPSSVDLEAGRPPPPYTRSPNTRSAKAQRYHRPMTTTPPAGYDSHGRRIPISFRQAKEPRVPKPARTRAPPQHFEEILRTDAH